MIRVNLKKTVSMLAVLSLMIGLTGCGTGALAGTGNLNQAAEVRIMCDPNYFPIIIAYKNGYFQEAFGDDVTVTYLQSDAGSVIMETMTAGEVDFCALGDMPIIQSRQNGLDVKVLSTLFTSTAGYELIAAPDSGIETVADLAGKRVAVMSGSTAHKLFLKYLEASNLMEDDVEILFLKDKDQLAAFVADSVDASVTKIPASRTIVNEANAYVVADAEGYDVIKVYMAGRDAFIQQNPAYAEAFLSAVIKATDWIGNNLEEAVEIVAEMSGVDYDTEELYYQTRIFEYALGEEEVAALEDTIQYLYDQGTIPRLVDVNELIDASYLNAALGVKE